MVERFGRRRGGTADEACHEECEVRRQDTHCAGKLIVIEGTVQSLPESRSPVALLRPGGRRAPQGKRAERQHPFLLPSGPPHGLAVVSATFNTLFFTRLDLLFFLFFELLVSVDLILKYIPCTPEGDF